MRDDKRKWPVMGGLTKLQVTLQTDKARFKALVGELVGALEKAEVAPDYPVSAQCVLRMAVGVLYGGHHNTLAGELEAVRVSQEQAIAKAEKELEK